METVLTAIPPARRRDRLLFRLIFETGMRVAEALGLHVEDLDLTADDERLDVMTNASTCWASAGSGARCRWTRGDWSAGSART